MLNSDIHPSTLVGIKRLAKQIKNKLGLPHARALDEAAIQAGFKNFKQAHKSLSVNEISFVGRFPAYFSLYWKDRKDGSIGRETLEIGFKKPLLEIATKQEIRQTAYVPWMRFAADDHLVSDYLYEDKGAAQHKLLKAACALLFIEGSGLRTARNDLPSLRKGCLIPDPPGMDHISYWHDPSNGQVVMIIEPYHVPEEIWQWARKYQMHVAIAEWPGIYKPGICDMCLITDATTGYDFHCLMKNINALPKMSKNKNVKLISALDHEVFLSPQAKTANDRRRAKSQGIMVRRPSKNTKPLPNSSERRPAVAMPVKAHIRVGELYKALYWSRKCNFAAGMALSRVSSILYEWLKDENAGSQHDKEALIDIYDELIPVKSADIIRRAEQGDTAGLIKELRDLLNKNYHDCEPLRYLQRWIKNAEKKMKRPGGNTEGKLD